MQSRIRHRNKATRKKLQTRQFLKRLKASGSVTRTEQINEQNPAKSKSLFKRAVGFFRSRKEQFSNRRRTGG